MAKSTPGVVHARPEIYMAPTEVLVSVHRSGLFLREEWGSGTIGGDKFEVSGVLVGKGVYVAFGEAQYIFSTRQLVEAAYALHLARKAAPQE